MPTLRLGSNSVPDPGPRAGSAPVFNSASVSAHNWIPHVPAGDLPSRPTPVSVPNVGPVPAETPHFQCCLHYGPALSTKVHFSWPISACCCKALSPSPRSCPLPALYALAPPPRQGPAFGAPASQRPSGRTRSGGGAVRAPARGSRSLPRLRSGSQAAPWLRPAGDSARPGPSPAPSPARAAPVAPAAHSQP